MKLKNTNIPKGTKPAMVIYQKHLVLELVLIQS